MSTSYGTSVNQSMESGTSSLLRSGLNISVGDTKSIVLALQALQQKIRALEQDRDFHQEQYDRALQAHEAYKLDMERQTEKERAEHRRREQELMDLLRKAREEKVKLESAVSGSHEDLSTFRAELERLIAAEREQSEQREGKLRGEISRLRQEMSAERAKYAALMQSLEKLRAEREEAYDTNEELRAAIADLERLRRQTLTAAATAPVSSRASPQGRTSGRNGATSGQTSRGRRAQGPRTSSHATSPPAHSRLQEGGLRATYRDPTCNSRLRDVRVNEGDVSCVCEAHNTAAAVRSASKEQHRHLLPGTSSFLSGGGGASPSSRTTSPSALRTRPVPVSGAGSPAHALREGDRPLPHHQELFRLSSNTGPSNTRKGAAGVAADPMALVEQQLREELTDLEREYKNTVDRASNENLPRHVVNTALERISELVDKKEEQLRLVQAARREVTENSATAQDRTGGTSVGYTTAEVLSDKATQRAQLVNELRSLLADEGKR